VAERHHAALPDACPHCRGPLIETDTAEQFQTEIPRQPLIRQFTVHIGHCGDCGRRTQGRHPLQTSDALGAAASQIGPDAQAAAALLHTQAGLSHGKVVAVFDALFGIRLTRGASAQINGRAGIRSEPEYRQLLASVRTSKQLAVDETGWRVGGHNAWLHVWVGDRATGYAIDSQRSADALERVIGRDWSGVLSHDGYGTYDRFAGALHQSCLAHVLRRTRELLADASRGAVAFPRQLIALFTEAIHRRNQLAGRAETDDERDRQRSGFDDRLLALLRPRRVVPAYTEAPGTVVHVRVRPVGRADQLEGRAGDPPGRGEPQGVGREPHPCWSRCATGTDVRVRDVPPARPVGARLRQPHPPLIREPGAATTRPHLRALNKYR
jgi:transposase